MKKTKNTQIETPPFLIIVESSSYCKHFSNFLGTKLYSIFPIKGHFLHISSFEDIHLPPQSTENGSSLLLPDESLHSNSTDYFPHFSLISSKASTAKNLKYEAMKYNKSNIIIATDNDREGEAIAYHLCQFLQLNIATTKRIIFNEITQHALTYAIQHPTRINMDIVYSQIARSIIDILIGFQISSILSKQFAGRNKGISAGRCQTIALRLVHEKQKQKKDEEQLQFHVKGYFIDSLCLPFHYSKQIDNETEAIDLLEKSKTHTFKILSIDKKMVRIQPPPPLQTSRLLQLAHNFLGYDSKKTMSIAQKLYEEGKITYLRTDSKLYSSVFIEQMKLFISQKYGQDHIYSHLDALKNDGTAGGALSHEAIHPTNIMHLEDTPLYQLIWKHSLQSCMSETILEEHTIEIDSPPEISSNSCKAGGGVFQHKIEIPIFLGWKTTSVSSSSSEKRDLQSIKNRGGNSNIATTKANHSSCINHLYSIDRKTPISCHSLECKQIVQTTNCYYTEASLIAKLEELQIGRPSTYSTFIETIIDRGYVVKKTIIGTEEDCILLQISFPKRGTRTKIDIKNEIHNLPIQRNIVKEQKDTLHNRLVIEPLGILCIEFLLEYFPNIFDYSYTQKMEMSLDNITEQSGFHTISIETQSEIQTSIRTIRESSKKSNMKAFALDDGYELIFSSKEPCIRRKKEGSSKKEYEYMSVYKNVLIDVDKLKRGEYTWRELVDIETPELGVYENEKMVLHNGPYGYYLEWGEKKISLSKTDLSEKEIRNMTLETGIACIEQETTRKEEDDERKGILRTFNDHLSVRQGKYGTYVYYMPPPSSAKPNLKPKPKFVSLKKCPVDFMRCSAEELIKWIEEKEMNPPSKHRFYKGGWKTK